MEVALPFPVSVGPLPTASVSGETAPEKGPPRSAFPAGWDAEFTGCRESTPPSGKKRWSPGVCLQSAISKEWVHLYNGRPPDLLRRPKFQRQGHVSPLPLAILEKTLLDDSGTAHEEASSGSVLDMTGCFPGLSSSRGLSSRSRPLVPLGRGLDPLPSTLPNGGAKLPLSEVQKEQLDGFSSSC